MGLDERVERLLADLSRSRFAAVDGEIGHDAHPAFGADDVTDRDRMAWNVLCPHVRYLGRVSVRDLDALYSRIEAGPRERRNQLGVRLDGPRCVLEVFTCENVPSWVETISRASARRLINRAKNLFCRARCGFSSNWWSFGMLTITGAAGTASHRGAPPYRDPPD
jgi:hypothetical protein